MKVIDLLNKIANGEEVPKKIKYDNQVFEYRKDMLDYYCYDYDLNLMGYQKILNDEVEIIEEDKKIDKYNTGLDNGKWNEESVKRTILEDKNIEDFLVRLMKETDAIKFKLYEIIDKINKD